jgi:hypothetical protein
MERSKHIIHPQCSYLTYCLYCLSGDDVGPEPEGCLGFACYEHSTRTWFRLLRETISFDVLISDSYVFECISNISRHI